MTREEQLDSCLTCVNRKFTMDKGIVCNLTGRIADFEKECPDYDVDIVEYEIFIPRSYKKYVDQSIHHEDFYYLVKDEGLKNYQTIDDIPVEVGIKDKILPKGLAVIILTMALSGGINQFDKEFTTNETLGYILLIGLSLWIMKIIYDMVNGKYEFMIRRDGIKQKDRRLIKWAEVEFIAIESLPNARFLIVAQKKGSITKFDIFGKNVDTNKISQFCYLYHQNARKEELKKLTG